MATPKDVTREPFGGFQRPTEQCCSIGFTRKDMSKRPISLICDSTKTRNVTQDIYTEELIYFSKRNNTEVTFSV